MATSPLRFKVDENLPTEVVTLLRTGGHDACSVIEQKLGGSSDEHIAEICQAENRVIITLDVGFADIRIYPPLTRPGLIVLRVGHQEKRHLMAVFERVLPLLTSAPLAGRIWVVTEAGVRIRGEPG